MFESMFDNFIIVMYVCMCHVPLLWTFAKLFKIVIKIAFQYFSKRVGPWDASQEDPTFCKKKKKYSKLRDIYKQNVNNKS